MSGGSWGKSNRLPKATHVSYVNGDDTLAAYTSSLGSVYAGAWESQSLVGKDASGYLIHAAVS